ncbi:uncharacterized protein EAE97_001536 [Botrytis byssoidea]|uniref:Uncharacterized protein n=1 Tax=Botrytis byssoidea TaxID=139641 RepID=A0A9P5M7T2_9HELO|nr:uncharacterized protein EAE97_001536 [Botrytis byssoidea]KAF7952039.1 hypothetical protein EAE97_001536 [Botrytis byssoidea]
MSAPSNLNECPIHIPPLGPFTPVHPSLTFTKHWTPTDEHLLQEDHLSKNFPLSQNPFPHTTYYSWNSPSTETSHPESDYVWRLAYKFFHKSPYDLFPRMKMGSELDLSDRGVCKFVAQILCIPGVQGNVEFLEYILQYAAHFICIRSPPPGKYAGKLPQPEHVDFMEILSEENILETSTMMRTTTHETPILHHRSDPDPSLIDTNLIPNLKLLTLVTTAWNLYAKARMLHPVSTYDIHIRLQLSAIEIDERVCVASFKREWKVQWPLEYRRNVVRRHGCGYAYLYRNVYARELVEFIERTVPEGWSLRDEDGEGNGGGDGEESFYSLRSIVQGIERCGGGGWEVRCMGRHLASIRGREWHCFSGDGGVDEGGEEILFFQVVMKRGWKRREERRGEEKWEEEQERKKERKVWSERVDGLEKIEEQEQEQEQEKQTWTAGPDEVFLDQKGEYVDMESEESWFITKEESETLSGCRNCCRPVCCQVRRRWNGVFVRTVV